MAHDAPALRSVPHEIASLKVPDKTNADKTVVVEPVRTAVGA